MNLQTARELVGSKAFWYQKFEIYPGLWTPGVYDPSGTFNALDLPEDLSGQRVLEVGPADGYFTRELSKRGADVLAVDYCLRDRHGFAVTELLYGKPLPFKQCNLFDMTVEEFGTFDIVLCLGVLYHLPDMIRGLWILRQMCARTFHLETAVCSRLAGQPIAEYLPADSNNHDLTNFWLPTPVCVQHMLRDTGFTVRRTDLRDTRAYFVATPDSGPNSQRKISAAYGAPTW